jgi:quercetin dioxygenase-like cupin family protein
MVETVLPAGITRAGEGQDEVSWSVLGHRYFLKAHGPTCFCFETFDPPGTFVPLHIHPRQDEFIYMLEGTCDLQLGEAKVQARQGDLVRMPMGLPHAYYNNTSAPTRALFWVTPAGRAQEAVRRAPRPDRHRRGNAPLGAARGRLRAVASLPETAGVDDEVSLSLGVRRLTPTGSRGSACGPVPPLTYQRPRDRPGSDPSPERRRSAQSVAQRKARTPDRSP